VLLWALQFIRPPAGPHPPVRPGETSPGFNLERKRKVVGSHFKTENWSSFSPPVVHPTFLLLVFAGTLLKPHSQKEQSVKPANYSRILEDTKAVADGFYVTTRT